MKHLYLIVVAVVLFATQTKAQTVQDTMYFWKTGSLILKQSIKTADLDSITFKRPAVIPPATVVIGSQVWTTKNLDVTTYSDGTPIPQVTAPGVWANLKTGAWCFYNNDAANGTTHGKLYNWYAVAGIHDTDPNTPNKKLAPAGYHIPTDDEWTTLTTFLGGESIAGGKMKATTLWQSPNTGATNSSGFTGLPSGNRTSTAGNDTNVGDYGVWWSATTYDTLTAWFRFLYFNDGSVNRHNWDGKSFGFSVRCLKD